MEGPAALMPLPSETGFLSYTDAYSSIPFRRSEYEANPSYRHDTAVELMFGQLRPTTVVRHITPHYSRYPDFYQYQFGVPYPAYRRVDSAVFGVPYSPFAYPYGLRSPP